MKVVDVFVNDMLGIYVRWQEHRINIQNSIQEMETCVVYCNSNQVNLTQRKTNLVQFHIYLFPPHSPLYNIVTHKDTIILLIKNMDG